MGEARKFWRGVGGCGRKRFGLVGGVRRGMICGICGTWMEGDAVEQEVKCDYRVRSRSVVRDHFPGFPYQTLHQASIT